MRRLALVPALAFIVTAAPARSQQAQWELVVGATEPIRIQRTLQEVTPDARQPGTMQFQSGVNVLAQLALYAIAQAVGGALDRKNKAEEHEVVVPVDQAMSSAVAVSDVGTTRKLATQDDVNRVIRPYAESLAGLSLHGLLSAHPGLPLALVSSPTAPPPVTRVTFKPVFVFAQDQRSISVVARVTALRLAGTAPAASPAEEVVQIILHASAHDEFDASEFWLKDDAKRLRETLSMLSRDALNIAVMRHRGELKDPPSATERTHRFRLGSDNVTVRGVQLSSSCEYTVVRDIRDIIVATPTLALRDESLIPAACAAQAAPK